MAINKKLKKFNDNGSYRNFLTTSDFQKPDASSIGAAAIPTNITQNPNHWYNASTNEGSRDDFYNNVPTMDLEYNPKCLLLVNCKYYVHPTATTISPIIDTVTDGTIGCWWRYTTGTTWTKLNSSDLQFYKGYTQSKITNLSFNTIGISNLRNDSNVEYMFSAQTPTVGTNCEEIVSYKFTDNCIQRGTITIDTTTFDATGGTKSVQLRTGAGNPWRITNTNGWLTFSTLTGVGPTTLSVTAAAHTSETERTGTVTVEYTDMVYSATGTFIQSAVDKHFDWDDAETSATPNMITINIGWDVTSVSETYNNNYTGLTVNGSTSWVTSKGLTSTSSNGSFTATTQQNTSSAERNYTFMIQSNGVNVGSIQIIQAAKPTSYLYVGNTAAQATTTACTYATTVSSAAGSYVIYYNTNYTAAEIGTFTFQNDAMFQSASFATTTTAGTINVSVKENSTGSAARSGVIWIKSGSTNVAKITFNQAAGATPPANYFYWNTTGSATTSGGSATYDVTSITCPYRTNISSLTTATTDTWITGATLNSGTFTVNFNQNSGTSERSGSVKIKNGSTEIAVFNITQSGQSITYYFRWSNGTSAITKSIAAATTADSTTYTTNYTDLIIESGGTYAWVTQKGITNDAGDGTFSATTQQNSTTTARTAEFTIKSRKVTMNGGSVSVEETTVGTLDLQQAATGVTYAITAYTGTSGTATATTVSETGGSFTVRVWSNQNWTGSSNQSWATLSPTTGTNSANTTVTVTANTGSQRIATLTFNGQHGQTCYISVTQSAYVPPVTYDFRWDDNGQTAITVSNISGDGETGRTGYEATGYTSIRVGTTPESWLTLSTNGSNSSYLYYTAATNGDSSRSDYNYIQGLRQDGVWENCGYITHQQDAGGTPPITYSITTHGSVTSVPMTGTTNSSCYVTAENQGWTLYSKPDWVSSVSPTTGSAGNTSLTITVSANETTSSRSGTIRINGNVSDYDTISVSQVAGSGSPVTYGISAYTGTSGTQTATTVDSGSTSFTARVITENQGWSVGSSTDSWLSASPSSDSGTKSVTISVEANPYTYSRTGYIYFDGSSSSYTRIKVEQAAKETPIEYGISAYTGTSGTQTATTVDSGSTSFTARVITENQGWSVGSSTDSWLSASPSSTGSSGTKYITVYVDANDSTSDRDGYIYFDGSVAGSDYIKVTQRAKYVPPTRTLTGLSITLSSVVEIPAGGGCANPSNSTYSVTGYYNMSPTTADLTNDSNVSVSGEICGSQLCSAKSRTKLGDLVLTASCSSITATSGSKAVYQEASTVVDSGNIVEETTHTAHTYTQQGTVYYSITVSPDSKSVGSASTNFSVTVSGKKNTPVSGFTYDTYKTKTTPYTAYTACVSCGSTQTSGVLSGSSSYVSATTNSTTSDVSLKSKPSWCNSSTSTSMIYVSANDGAERSGDVVYQVTADTSVTGSCTVTQAAKYEATRSVTVYSSSTMRVEHSSFPAAHGDSVNFFFNGVGTTDNRTISYSCDFVYDGTQNEYSDSGSITFYDVSTGATTVTLQLSAMQFERAGHFYGVSGSFSSINVNVGSAGTSWTGNDTITLNVSAGSSDTTIYLTAGGSPTMVYDY